MSPKNKEMEKCKKCGKNTCLICNSIRTTTAFTMDACRETFNIQSGRLDYNSEEVLYLFKCKGEAW